MIEWILRRLGWTIMSEAEWRQFRIDAKIDLQPDRPPAATTQGAGMSDHVTVHQLEIEFTDEALLAIGHSLGLHGPVPSGVAKDWAISRIERAVNCLRPELTDDGAVDDEDLRRHLDAHEVGSASLEPCPPNCPLR